MRLLVVEDDPQIAESLARGLRRSGHVVDALADGRSAIEALRGGSFDLVVLDLGLPGIDGLSVLRFLRGKEQKAHVPVLILTARDELGDRVQGLDLGADDYMVKPFELPELEARIRALARRTWAGTGGDVRAGALVLKMAQRRFYVGDLPLELSRREFGILELLVLRQGHVVSKAQLEQHVCNWDEQLTDSAIELYVHRIRKKLEFAGVAVRTVRGLGYLLEEAGAP